MYSDGECPFLVASGSFLSLARGCSLSRSLVEGTTPRHAVPLEIFGRSRYRLYAAADLVQGQGGDARLVLNKCVQCTYVPISLLADGNTISPWSYSLPHCSLRGIVTSLRHDTSVSVQPWPRMLIGNSAVEGFRAHSRAQSITSTPGRTIGLSVLRKYQRIDMHVRLTVVSVRRFTARLQ